MLYVPLSKVRREREPIRSGADDRYAGPAHDRAFA